MKIEIGESLVRSWLRHCEACEFAELNWKPSSTWSAQPNSDSQKIFDQARNEWPEALGKNSLSQFIKQAEIDVLGLSTTTNIIHMVDIAFHSGGLNYGAKGKTGERIYKKLIRSALIAKTYFPNNNAIIYFVTPQISPSIKLEIESATKKANSLFSDGQTISFELIIGDEFNEKIIQEVLALGGDIADTSELFLRSWQLIQPFINHKKVDEQIVSKSPRIRTNTKLNTQERKQMHISALYMSRFGHTALNKGNQTQTFNYLSKKHSVPVNSIRNIRDSFDFYVDNNRVGWDKPLPDYLQVILEEYIDFSESDLRKLV